MGYRGEALWPLFTNSISMLVCATVSTTWTSIEAVVAGKDIVSDPDVLLRITRGWNIVAARKEE